VRYLEKYPEDLMIVIRSAGERTKALCEQIVRSQAPLSELHVIEEKPFLRAVKKTMQLGSESSGRFMLALDADVLLYQSALEYIMYEANMQDYDKLLRMDFWLMDKFRGKAMGIHLYNNKYSKDFYDFLSDIDDQEYFIRPEGNNFLRFAKQTNLRYGYIADKIAGKHDYFQYYSDLIKKYVLRYQRCEQDGILEENKKLFREKRMECPDDSDFVVVNEVFKAMSAGKNTDGILQKLGIEEKKPIDPMECALITDSLQAYPVMIQERYELRDKTAEGIKSYKNLKTFFRKLYHPNSFTGTTAIYGAGELCELLVAQPDIPVCAVIVSDPPDGLTSFHGIPVITLDKARDYGVTNIVIASIAHAEEIRRKIFTVYPENTIRIFSPEFV
jgi:hypothetical protein